MKKFELLVLMMITGLTVIAADIYDDISSAIRTGNSKQLVSYVGKNIDITIGSQEAIYSKAQAEQIIRDFFTKNTPKSFTILHKGSSKDGIMYAIGSLITGTGKTFRTSFYFKHSSNNAYILQEMRFETE